MEKIDNILFIDRFPKLDLHGYTSDIAALAVNDFINDNIKMKNEIIVIIHGIGTGTVMKSAHRVLKQNKNVLEYKIYYNNRGCTVVRLKI